MKEDMVNSYLRMLDARIRTNLKLDWAAVMAKLIAADSPPWRPISSRMVSRLLGVSLQSLANWRVRGTGPEPEAMMPGRGHRIWYRPDSIMAWLSGGTRQWWHVSADWLDAQGIGVDEVDEAAVVERIALLERLNLWPKDA